MISIRIGNDIKLVWSIFDGWGNPYPLRKEMKLTLKCRNFLYNIEDYTVEDNKITFTFFGKDQTTIGTYMLTLVENDDEVGMQTVDCCSAFRLVPTSCEQTNDNDDVLNPEVIALNLTSNIDYYTEGGGSTPITEVVVKDITLSAIYDNVKLNVTKTNNTQSNVALPIANENSAGLLTRDMYRKFGLLGNQYEVDANNAYMNLNNCIDDGQYIVSNQTASAYLNWPLQNESTVSGKLTVLTAYEGNNFVTTQLLYLNNCSGGDGNMYIRAKQGDVWEKWGKLQTNIEVGFTNTFDQYIDNGMYSGVFNDGTNPETFVLIVINDYMVNQVIGRNEKSITQLKYALSTNDGTPTIKTRTKPYNTGTWSEWSDVSGGGSSITVDTALSTTSTNAVQNKVITQAIDNKADKSSVVNQTATTATIEPNTLNVWGSVTELNITLGAEKTGVINEYMIQFTSSASGTSLVLPSDIKWLSAPTITENKVYQISIINKLAVIAEFPNE